MSFESVETSEFENRPRELYWFMRGTDQWTYASGAEAIDFDGQTFEPVNGLARGNIRVGGERARTQMTVVMPRDTGIAGEFIGIPNVSPVWLYIYRIHDDETTYAITWQGRVRYAEFAGVQTTLTLDSIVASGKKQALRHLFQNQCNHFTFDANCGLIETDFERDATIASIDANFITADEAEDEGFYIAGQVRRANGDRRFVVSDTKSGSTHTLELLTPFEDLDVGEAVTLIGGACRHTFDTCPVEVKPNYGGFPKVPRVNPFKSFH